MTWDCCTPTGLCQRGPGCPAGGACHSQAGCADTPCPGHPGTRVARVKASRPVPITLDKSATAPWPSQRISRVKQAGQWALAIVLTLIWALISTGVRDADEAAAAECAAPTARQAVNPDCYKHPTHWSTKA